MTGSSPPLSVTPSGTPWHRFSHNAMACTWELYLLEDDGDYAAQVARVAFEEVDRIEGELSRFIPRSDVGRINSQPAGEPLRIGVDAFQCLVLSAQLHATTLGAFDVTLGTGFSELVVDGTARTVTRGECRG